MTTKTMLKTNIPGLQKDKETGTIINANHDEFKRFNMARQKALEEKSTQQKIDILENNVNGLMKEVSEIKKMFVDILNGRTNE